MKAGTTEADRKAPLKQGLWEQTRARVLITSHAVKFGERDARLVMAESLTDDPDLEID